MKFKEIKPGMVIHCPKEEDARVLSEYLIKLGVVNANHIMEYYGSDNGVGKIDTVLITRREGNLYAEYSDRKWFEKDEYHMKITEFSDLIEPEANKANDLANSLDNQDNDLDNQRDNEMSAVEVLEWFTGADSHVLAEIFDYRRDVGSILGQFTVSEIIDRITTYEAAKKAPKPVEVEWETQYIIKSHHPDLQKWEDRVIVIGYENAREMRENSERILKEHINSVVGENKYPASDYYVIPLRRCRVKGE